MIAANVNRGYNSGVKVTATETAQKQFVALPRVIQTRVLTLFERLRGWPMVSGAKPLTGKLAGRYRLRTGDYRVQFRVDHGRMRRRIPELVQTGARDQNAIQQQQGAMHAGQQCRSIGRRWHQGRQRQCKPFARWGRHPR